MYNMYKLCAETSTREYIGRTKRHLKDRLVTHKNTAIIGRCDNKDLEKWINENRDTLQIELIEKTEDKTREKYWIKKRFSESADLLNVIGHPEKEKIWKERLGETKHTHTKETIQKISDTKKGKTRQPFSDIWKENMSKAKTGKNNPRYGIKHTEETKQKMREKRRLFLENKKKKI